MMPMQKVKPTKESQKVINYIPPHFSIPSCTHAGSFVYTVCQYILLSAKAGEKQPWSLDVENKFPEDFHTFNFKFLGINYMNFPTDLPYNIPSPLQFSGMKF